MNAQDAGTSDRITATRAWDETEAGEHPRDRLGDSLRGVQAPIPSEAKRRQDMLASVPEGSFA